LGLLGVRAPKKSDFLPRLPEAASKDFVQLVGEKPLSDAESRQAVLRTGAAFGWADTVARWYAQTYQSAYISNFVLAALALVASVVPFIFEWNLRLTFLLGSVAVAFVGLIYINTFLGNLRNWHRRWMEAREVAERLRANLPMWLLGKKPRHNLRGQTWVDWYVNTSYRAMGVYSGILNPQELLAIKATIAAILNDQAQYHKQNARLMNRIEARLFTISAALFIASLLLFVTPGKNIQLLSIVGLAAIGVAIFGIRLTGDFEGQAERSEGAAATLSDLRDALQSDSLTLSHLRARANTVYDMMVKDVVQWRYTTQSRPLANPT